MIALLALEPTYRRGGLAWGRRLVPRSTRSWSPFPGRIPRLEQGGQDRLRPGPLAPRPQSI